MLGGVDRADENPLGDAIGTAGGLGRENSDAEIYGGVGVVGVRAVRGHDLHGVEAAGGGGGDHGDLAGVERVGEVRQDRSVTIDGLGEGDQVVGEAFIKWARSAMNARA